jgi:hypothetical protein
MVVWGHGTSSLAVSEANKFMNQVLGSLRQDNVNLLEGMDIQLHIIPYNMKLTDLNEFSFLKGMKDSDGRNYDDLRGVGGTKFGSSILYAVAEETLVHIPGKPSGYYSGFVVSHESGHVVEQFALTKTQRNRLQEAYNARKDANGPWLSAYASSNLHEYFAQSTAAFFGHPQNYKEADKLAYTRAWLKKNDRLMYKLLTDVYKRAPA